MEEDVTRCNILFVCTQNRLRSPTTEKIFREDIHLNVRSAGLNKEAVVPLTLELVEWADIVFVMEKGQKDIIRKRFGDICRRKRIVCLYIPDEYDFMSSELIQLLIERVTPYINERA